MDLLIVGAGLFGLTVAERAASSGVKVTLIDRRSHIGGNAYSEADPETGIEVHMYGSHIFHTSNRRVWNYVTRFTKFNNYTHRVYTVHNGSVFSLPINLATINQFYRSALTPSEARALVRRDAGEFDPTVAHNLEERAIGLVGRPLYNAFIKNYTYKQWQTNPRELPAAVIDRLPVRYTYDSRYFSDMWEGIPRGGYTSWFERMVDHPNISVALGVDFLDEGEEFSKSRMVGQVPIVYTGPLDRYFGYHAGRLKWRTLEFEMDVLAVGDHQGTAVMNYADATTPYTRVHEFRHFHPELAAAYPSDRTVVAREYSRFATSADEPYYPVNSTEDRATVRTYRTYAKGEASVYFGGRLGTYKYLDMHMAVASALTFWDKLDLRASARALAGG